MERWRRGQLSASLTSCFMEGYSDTLSSSRALCSEWSRPFLERLLSKEASSASSSTDWMNLVVRIGLWDWVLRWSCSIGRVLETEGWRSWIWSGDGVQSLGGNWGLTENKREGEGTWAYTLRRVCRWMMKMVDIWNYIRQLEGYFILVLESSIHTGDWIPFFFI